MKALLLRRVLIFAVLAVSAVLTASAQYNQPDSSKPHSNKLTAAPVKTGLFMFSGEGNNSLLRLSANGLVIVDGKLSGNYEELTKRTHRISDQPIRFLILTSASQAGTGNDAKFLENGTRIIAQAQVATVLAGQKNADGKSAPVSISFDRDYQLHLGGIEVQIMHFGNAYSTGDTVVYYPNLKTVAVGALFSPDGKVTVAEGGNLMQWGAVLAEVMKLDFDTVVPASGPVVTRAELAVFKSKMDNLSTRASALVKKGVPKDQLMSELNTGDIGLQVSLTPSQLDHFYAELSATQVANR